MNMPRLGALEVRKDITLASLELIGTDSEAKQRAANEKQEVADAAMIQDRNTGRPLFLFFSAILT